MHDTQRIDPAVLQQLKEDLGGDQEILEELVDDFIRDTPDLLAEMRQALAATDLPVLLRTAHTLKSTSAVLGALPLSRLSQELEEAIHTAVDPSRTEKFAPLVEKICQLFDETAEEMRAVITSDRLDG